MGNLLSTLLSSAGTLKVYDRVLEVTQNNVANASTPGFAKQSLTLSAMSFDSLSGSSGGVTAGELKSSRDEYAEQTVRRQTSSLGAFEQRVSSLTALNGSFDVSGDS